MGTRQDVDKISLLVKQKRRLSDGSRERWSIMLKAKLASIRKRLKEQHDHETVLELRAQMELLQKSIQQLDNLSDEWDSQDASVSDLQNSRDSRVDSKSDRVLDLLSKTREIV